MESNIIIRAAAANDLVFVCDLYELALKEEISSSNASSIRHFDESSRDEIKSFFSEVINNSLFGLFVVEIKNKIAGYLLICERQGLAEAPKIIGFVNGIYVLPEMRKCGIASKLMKMGFDWFKLKNLSIIELNTTIGSKPAHEFWKRLGFIPLETVYFYHFPIS